MRIKAVHVAGLAAALIGGAAEEAAADTTISAATTAPVQTSTAGNVTVDSNGSITVTTGQTAITVNSNNNVSNAGSLASSDASDSTGILLGNGFSGTINNTNLITLTETYTLADTDDDGDLDGPWALGSNRFGILLGAGSTFTGDVNVGGIVTVEGNNSAAVAINGLLNGDLTKTGAINVTGDNSAGLLISGGAGAGVTGDVILHGNFSAFGQNSSAVVVDAPIGGQLRINGTLVSTGYHSTARPIDATHLDADDFLQSGATIAIHSDVAGGVTLEGIGVEDDVDDDGDGVLTDDTDDNLTSSITSFGSSPALLIQADPGASIVVGPNSNGLGLQARGNLVAAGIYDGVVSHAISVLGNGAATTTIQGGIALDFSVSASAFEADAYGLYIGANASTPQVLQRKTLTVTTISETATNAYGVFVDTGATVPSFSNSGTLVTQVFGEAGSATAITDRSSTLATITNSGTLVARIVPSDADPTDNVPPPPVTGSSTAIDVSTSTIGVTFNQIADVPFTDDDTVDDDVNSRPEIHTAGDIKFGSGADAVNLLAGTVAGNISFGAGADAMTVDNGSIFTGRITDSDGALTLNVVDGTLTLQGGETDITSATFGADSQLGALLSPTPSENTLLLASGTVTFAAGARIVPIVAPGLPASGVFTFLTANGGIVGGANVTGVVSGADTPFVYNLSINQTGNSLAANFVLKTAAELGLNANQAIAFDPIINALRQDANVGDAFAGLTTQKAFESAYGQLMPSYSSASTELAATAIQQQQSATTNRLSATRLSNLNEVSVWTQEIGYVLNREPPSGSGGERFRGNGFGLALGIDGPMNNGALFGLSASFVTSDSEQPIRPDGQISSSFGQGNAYLGTAVGPIDLDFVAGLGVGRMQERRVVEFGAITETTSAEWWAYEGHAIARASAPMRASNWLVITPSAALTYVGLHEDGYTEEGGGAAIDLEAGDAFSQRLWADAGVEFSGRWSLGGDAVFAPRLYVGYRLNALDDPTDREFKFTSTGESFSLTDDKLGDGGPLIGIGVDATNGYSTISLSYEGEFTDQIERHSLNLAIRYRF